MSRPLVLLLLVLALALPAAAQDPAAMQDHRRRMLELFHRLDRDGDGKLQPADLQGYPRLRSLDRNGDGQVELREVAPVGEPFLGERLLQVFRAADRNGDGLLSLEETSLLPGIRDHFGRFDRNADGFVSLEELMLFRRSLAPKRYRQAE